MMLSLIGVGLAFMVGCGPSGQYSRSWVQAGGDAPEGGAIVGGTDGGQIGSGGIGGSGGLIIGTGGVGTGGAASTATGGSAASSGGEPGPGGRGAGGIVSTGGGAGTGGGATGGLGGSAAPCIISIDFIGNHTVMTASESAGVKPAAHWNGAAAVSGSLSNLIDKDAVATGAAATWDAGSGVFRVAWTDKPGDTRMMIGYLDPTSSAEPATVTITGLPSTFTSGNYDVYVYSYSTVSVGSRDSKFTIGTKSTTITTNGPTAATFTGYTLAPDKGSGNYVVFRGLTGSSFTLTAAPGATNGAAPRSPLNGLQIVAPSGS